MGREPGERARLVLAHEQAVADHIGRQDGGKPTFDTLPCHGYLHRFVLIMGGSLGEALDGV
jgi:hypothetical protein